MGPMNWIGVVAAALVAAGLVLALRRGTAPLAALGGMLLSAAMLGHALARIGAEKLAAKPWLYFMQSGGLALAFVLPGLWLLGLRGGAAKGEMARDSAAFVLAYLAMGAVFWGLGGS